MAGLNFRSLTISVAFIFTFLLFAAIATLFLLPKPSDVLEALKSEEMLYSLKLSLITASLSTVLVILMGYRWDTHSHASTSLERAPSNPS